MDPSFSEEQKKPKKAKKKKKKQKKKRGASGPAPPRRPQPRHHPSSRIGFFQAIFTAFFFFFVVPFAFCCRESYLVDFSSDFFILFSFFWYRVLLFLFPLPAELEFGPFFFLSRFRLCYFC